MRAVWMHELGPPGVLRLGDAPDPEPAQASTNTSSGAAWSPPPEAPAGTPST